MFKCQCNREFKNTFSLGSHRGFCVVYKETIKKQKQQELKKQIYKQCPVCKRKFKSVLKHISLIIDDKHKKFFLKQKVKAISNDTANCLVAQFRTLEEARDLVRTNDLTIIEEC